MSEAPSRFVDLSHSLRDGMAPYPGLPGVHIGPHIDHDASRANYEGDEFFLGKVDMPANVGTYIDSPFHRFRERDDLAALPLDRLVGIQGVVVDAPAAGRSLGPELAPEGIEGRAVLFRSGWDARWGTDAYWEAGPFLSEELASRVVEGGAALVGVDFWNVDDTTTKRRPIHTRLLDAGTLIVEHLSGLEQLPTTGFRFFAPVVRVEGGASFPVRAFAEIG